MEEQLKLTDEQLRILRSKLDTYTRAQLEIGALEAKKHELLHSAVSAKERLQDYQAELKNQYGDIYVNIDDGTYTKSE